MKGIEMTRLALALSILVLTSCATVPSKNANLLVDPNAWEMLVTEPYKGKRDSVSFVNERVGWYGTGKGDLYRTQDGGETWDLIKQQAGTFIRAVAFQDENSGYIGNVGTEYYPGVTDETPLYYTTDGGMTWTPVDLGDHTIKGVCAIDILKTERIYQGELAPATVIHAAGRVGGPTGILRSTDDGRTWSVIDMAPHAGMILDVKFLTEQTGLVFASTSANMGETEGLILRTIDGGKNWTEVYRSGRKHELIWKASFPDSENGFATIQSYDGDRSTQLIVKTYDGGKSWQEIEMAQNAKARQFGIGFVDENLGWVGTMDGGYFTADGGRTFQPAPVAKAANKFQIIHNDDGEPTSVFAIGTELQKLPLQNLSANQSFGRE